MKRPIFGNVVVSLGCKQGGKTDQDFRERELPVEGIHSSFFTIELGRAQENDWAASLK